MLIKVLKYYYDTKIVSDDNFLSMTVLVGRDTLNISCMVPKVLNTKTIARHQNDSQITKCYLNNKYYTNLFVVLKK